LCSWEEARSKCMSKGTVQRAVVVRVDRGGTKML
jgi:hypothetical protein